MKSSRQWRIELWITQREVSAIQGFLGLRKNKKKLRDDVPLSFGVFRRLVQLAEACKPAIVTYPGQD